MNNNEPPERPQLLRVVAVLLVVIVVCEVSLLVGRALGCMVRNGWGACPFEEVRYGVDQMTSLLATIIALIFALIKR
jgi:hypothetical protein